MSRKTHNLLMLQRFIISKILFTREVCYTYKRSKRLVAVTQMKRFVCCLISNSRNIICIFYFSEACSNIKSVTV